MITEEQEAFLVAFADAYVATADEVSRFNDLFKLVNARRDSRHHGERGTVAATWVNIALILPARSNTN